MIEVEQLTKAYGDFTAIRELSFRVAAGEVVGFLGVNGAGKTTTLRILACYLPPTSGQVRIAGLDVTRRSMQVRQQIGYLPESVPLYNELRVKEYLAFRAALKGVGRRQVKAEVDRVARRCILSDHLRQTIGTLSRGYRQRVGLADALLGSPKLLILDEPTSGQDPIQRIQVRELVRELRGEHTVILSTHVLSEVESMCSRVLILRDGRLVPEDDVGQLRGRACYEIKAVGAAHDILTHLARLDAVERVAAKKDTPAEEGAEGHDGTALENRAEFAVWEVTPKPGMDPRDAIVSLFASRQGAGWRLLELRERVLSLEEIFALSMGDTRA